MIVFDNMLANCLPTTTSAGIEQTARKAAQHLQLEAVSDACRLQVQV